MPGEKIATALAIPEWVNETYDLCSGYYLQVEEKSVFEETIEMTRDEYIALKAHLAKMRGYTI